MSNQPEALKLADFLEDDLVDYDGKSIPRLCQDVADKAAVELRRLHAETTNQQDWFVEWKKCEQQVVKLRKLHAEQRDELLEALLYAITQVPELSTVLGIRAAIAKATGEQL